MTTGFIDLCLITFVFHLSENNFVYGSTNLSRSPVSNSSVVNQSQSKRLTNRSGLFCWLVPSSRGVHQSLFLRRSTQNPGYRSYATQQDRNSKIYIRECNCWLLCSAYGANMQKILFWDSMPACRLTDSWVRCEW
jgi:hypothetical protein